MLVNKLDETCEIISIIGANDSKELIESLKRYIQNSPLSSMTSAIVLGGWIEDSKFAEVFEKLKGKKNIRAFLITESYDKQNDCWASERYTHHKNYVYTRILAEFLNAPIISIHDPDWGKKIQYFIQASDNQINHAYVKLNSIEKFLESVRSYYLDSFKACYADPEVQKIINVQSFVNHVEEFLEGYFKNKELSFLFYLLGDYVTSNKKNRRASMEHEFQHEAMVRIGDPKILTKIQAKHAIDAVADCIDALRQPALLEPLLNKNEGDEFNIVIFDNNLSEECITLLRMLKGLFPNTNLFYTDANTDFQIILKTLSMKNIQTACENLIEIKSDSSADDSVKKHDLQWNKIDLILQDLYLGYQQPSGHEMISELLRRKPEIPVFVYSSSPSVEDINEAYQRGADNYIWKEQTLALPKKILEYFENIGTLVTRIASSAMRRNLVGNIRHWRQRREHLWFGDKCYHMINHSYSHAMNNWQIAHQLLPKIFDNINRKPVEKRTIPTDADLYCFLMAIWLHDMGHKGNERYGEPHEIRDLHGLISAELFLKHPKHYGIYGFEQRDASPYRWLTFTNPRTSTQTIRDRIASLEAAVRIMRVHSNFEHDKQKEQLSPDFMKQLTILEKIALLCMYHKSNFPMDELDVQNLIKKGKRIPNDCHENFDRQTEPICLKSFSDLMGDSCLLPLMALFRFVDGLDCNKNRVGDVTEEGIKKETIRRDIKYQLYKLQLEVLQLAASHLKSTGKEKRFVNLFYEQAKNEIEKQQWISKDLKREQRAFLDSLEVDVCLDNYNMLLEYIEYISVQDGHFDLHNSIEKIEIREILEGEGNLRFKIEYHSLKDVNYLETKEVKLRGQEKGRNIRDHLLGLIEKDKDGQKCKRDGYVREELNNGKRYLEDWFDLNKTEIVLILKDRKTYREPDIKHE